jgi:poly(hydroxyalkanoate) depolymerase family esterase
MIPLIVALLTAMPADTGRFVQEQYDGAGGARSYMLYIPSGYDGARQLPLVVALHGCTQSAADLAAGSRLNVAAERDTFLVAYPEQSPDAHPMKCWNWYLPEHQKRDDGEPALVAGITRQVQQQYSVDTTRTFLAGISAGAALAVHTAVAYFELYRALALHAGVPYRAAASMAEALEVLQSGIADPQAHVFPARAQFDIIARTLPVIIFHGQRDALVAVRNGEQLARQWLALHRVHPDAASNGGVTTAGTSLGGYHYTRTVHTNEHAQTLVELWLVDELGHAWSGGSRDGTYTDAAGPDATAEMLRFFRAVP